MGGYMIGYVLQRIDPEHKLRNTRNSHTVCYFTYLIQQPLTSIKKLPWVTVQP